MDDATFIRHIRAYILFMIGCYLLPDTSGSEVHLRYLPLLEDLSVFCTYSVGGAVLCHLYRELTLATKPHRANIAGCIHLLQLWCWERLHVGRPTLHVPQDAQLESLSVGYRWNSIDTRQVRTASIAIYRDEIDGLQDSQIIWHPYTPEIRAHVAQICLVGEAIWMARTPLISWTRVEWHLPDRVQRQFGLIPSVHLQPIDPSFCRTDGRGKSETDWLQFYQVYIGNWEDRRSNILQGAMLGPDSAPLIFRYLKWYRAWAKLYMLKPPTEPPRTYYQRAPLERQLREFFLETESTLQPYFGRTDLGPMEPAVIHMEELIRNMHHEMHIADERYVESMHTPYDYFNDSQEVLQSMDAGPSSEPPPSQVGPSSEPPPSQVFLSDVANWPSDSDFEEEPNMERLREAQQQPTTASDDDFQEEAIHRLRRPPQKYTPGSTAIYRRRNKKR